MYATVCLPRAREERERYRVPERDSCAALPQWRCRSPPKKVRALSLSGTARLKTYPEAIGGVQPRATRRLPACRNTGAWIDTPRSPFSSLRFEEDSTQLPRSSKSELAALVLLQATSDRVLIGN